MVSSHARRPKLNVAWAFLFLLAMHEVSALRENVDMMAADAHVASILAEGTRVNGNLDAMKEAREFSIKTHWARGKESKLKWKEAEVSFAIVAGSGRGPEEYVQMSVAGKTYTIMPDAAVVSKTINGMATVSIVGWREGKKDPVYKKNDALYLRTEKNPFIGLTEDDWGHWRYAGYKVYKPEGKRPYYIRKDGKMFVIEWDAVKHPQPVVEPFQVQVAGRSEEMKRPDTEVMLLLDTMLGQSSCLNNPSQCAFRCFYNPEEDVCGPTAFCQKIEKKSKMPAGGKLAPFGSEQKCKAVGSDESHEAADVALEVTGMDHLKQRALGLVDALAAAPEISQTKASKKTMKQTMALFSEVSDLLTTFQTLPSRLSEKNGNFPKALARINDHKDLKHFRSGSKPLSKDDYQAASGKTVKELQKSRDFSVPAKLHSELVDFLIKRPKVLIEGAKQGSNATNPCVLSAETDEDKKNFEKFVKYYMGVPTFNKADVKAGTTGLGESCENYLLKGMSNDVIEKADVLQDENDKERQKDAESQYSRHNETLPQENHQVSGKEGLLDINTASVSRAEAVGDEITADESLRLQAQGQGPEDVGLLQQRQAQAEAEEAAFVITILAIFAIIVLSVISGLLLTGAGLSLQSGEWTAYFVCAMLGGLVITGAFCMATPIGWWVLVLSVVGAVVGNAGASFTQTEALAKAAKRQAQPHRYQALSAALHLSS